MNWINKERELREFGFVFGGALTFISFAFFLSGREIFFYGVVTAPFLVVLGIVSPPSLTLLFRLWMGLAHIIGAFMTRVVLTILYFIVFVPLGILLKLFGKRLLDTMWPDTRLSNWESRKEATSREQYEKQY